MFPKAESRAFNKWRAQFKHTTTQDFQQRLSTFMEHLSKWKALPSDEKMRFFGKKLEIGDLQPSAQYNNWSTEYFDFYMTRFPDVKEMQDFRELVNLIWKTMRPEEKSKFSVRRQNFGTNHQESDLLVWLRGTLDKSELEELERDPITVIKEWEFAWRSTLGEEKLLNSCPSSSNGFSLCKKEQATPPRTKQDIMDSTLIAIWESMSPNEKESFEKRAMLGDQEDSKETKRLISFQSSPNASASSFTPRRFEIVDRNNNEDCLENECEKNRGTAQQEEILLFEQGARRSENEVSQEPEQTFIHQKFDSCRTRTSFSEDENRSANFYIAEHVREDDVVCESVTDEEAQKSFVQSTPQSSNLRGPQKKKSSDSHPSEPPVKRQSLESVRGTVDELPIAAEQMVTKASVSRKLSDSYCRNWQSVSKSPEVPHNSDSTPMEKSPQNDSNPPDAHTPPTVPPNSYVLFTQHRKQENPEVTFKMNQDMWKNMTEEEKRPYQEEHMRLTVIYRENLQDKKSVRVRRKKAKLEKMLGVQSSQEDESRGNEIKEELDDDCTKHGFFQSEVKTTPIKTLAAIDLNNNYETPVKLQSPQKPVSPKRPPSGYALWVQAQAELKRNGGPKVFTGAKGDVWYALTPEEKRPYMEEAERLWIEFEKNHPEYKSKWRRRRDYGTRRKAKKDLRADPEPPEERLDDMNKGKYDPESGRNVLKATKEFSALPKHIGHHPPDSPEDSWDFQPEDCTPEVYDPSVRVQDPTLLGEFADLQNWSNSYL